MGSKIRNFLGLWLLAFVIDTSLACEGHKLKVHYIKNCGDAANNIMKVQENSTIIMTKDCEVIPNACAETVGFKEATVHYTIWKNNLPILRGDIDACEMANKLTSDIKAILKLFGLPSKCPVEKMKKCEDGTKKAEVMEKYKKFLSLARGGPIKIEAKIDHDNGKSCFQAEFELIKKL